MIIKRGVPHCRVVKGDPAKIKNALSIEDPKAHFKLRHIPVWKRKEAAKKAKITLLTRDGSFPFGLLPQVIKHCRRKGIPLRLLPSDEKPFTKVIPPVGPYALFDIDMSGEREYQADMIDLICKHRVGAAQLATNAGKTPIMAGTCCHLYQQAGIRSIVVVPNATLLFSIAEDFKKMLPPDVTVGILGQGRRETDAKVIIATAQTLVKATLKTCPFAHVLKRKAILIDEAHHASADTWVRILSHSSAIFRICLSGSFDNPDDAVKSFVLKAYTGRTLAKVSNTDMISAGLSAKMFVFCIRDRAVWPQLATEYYERDYDGQYLEDETGKKVRRDPLKVYQEEKRNFVTNREVLALTARVAKSFVVGKLKPFVSTDLVKSVKKIDKAVRRVGLEPITVYGGVAANARGSMVKAFDNNSNAVLIGNVVFKEGMNIPHMNAAIMASGSGKAVQSLKQWIGRAVRKKKAGPNVVAFVDLMPTTARTLDRHAERRLQVYRSEGFQIIEVNDFEAFCNAARNGWKGLAKEYGLQLQLSEKRRVRLKNV